MRLTAFVKTIGIICLSLVFNIDTLAQNGDSTISINTSSNNFIQFNAIKFGSNIELKWRATAKGTGQFIIERSKDGVNFQKIGVVSISKMAGTFNYVFSDRSPIKDKNYYRIKLSENNVLITSGIATADFTEGNAYNAYPTSVTTTIFIKIPKPTKITIYNNSGELVKSFDLNESGNVNLSDLYNGNYQLRFEGSNEFVRFIKM